MNDYLTLLREELETIRGRLESAEPEAVPVLRQWIAEIQRDIVRYSAIPEDRHGKTGADRNQTETGGTGETGPRKKRRNTDFANLPQTMKE